MVQDNRVNTPVVLIAGLSKAGKSTIADKMCALNPKVTHVPLDRYFHSTPLGLDFIKWVQDPKSIDWDLLREHLRRVEAGYPCYTPVIDWRNTGQRIHPGGAGRIERSHFLSPSPSLYVIPGCFAFHYPFTDAPIVRLYVDCTQEVVEQRRHTFATEVPIHKYAQDETIITRQRRDADFTCDGEWKDEQEPGKLLRQIQSWLKI